MATARTLAARTLETAPPYFGGGDRPVRLTAGQAVADAATGRRHGKVLAVPRANLVRVAWLDGEVSNHNPADLIGRFSTPAGWPARRKGGAK